MQFRHFIRARRQHWDNTPVTNPDVNIRKNTTTDSLGILFTLFELKRAISNTWQSTPGKNRVCYSILAHLEDSALNAVLRLFSKVCLRNRQNIIAWKQSIIVPVLIPGKHPSDPSSDRPTALTSQLGKTGGHNNRQINLLSRKRPALTSSKWVLKREAMDPILCLESEIRKAQTSGEVSFLMFKKHMTCCGRKDYLLNWVN